MASHSRRAPARWLPVAGSGRGRVLLLAGPAVALALALVATPATAKGTGDVRADRSIARYAVPTPAGLTVLREPCPGTVNGACSDPDTGRVWAPRRHRFALAHELGHVYLERLDGYWQGRLMIRLGFDPATEAWDGAHGPGEVHGLDCVGGRRVVTGGWESAYGYEPSRRQHLRVCRVIRASG
jgi:hypothetical protein